MLDISSKGFVLGYCNNHNQNSCWVDMAGLLLSTAPWTIACAAIMALNIHHCCVVTQEAILRLLACASQIVLAKEFIPILSIPGCWLLLTKKNGQVDLEILNCQYLIAWPQPVLFLVPSSPCQGRLIHCEWSSTRCSGPTHSAAN